MSLNIKKNNIYPVFALFVGLLFFFSGLFFVTQRWFIYFLILIMGVYILFGYARTCILFILAAIPLAGITVLFAIISAPFDKAVQNGLRMLLFILSAVAPVSIEPIMLTRNLNQLHVPRGITVGLIIALRFIHVFRTETKRIRIAMKTRGVYLSIRRPRILYRAFLIPLIIRVISISDTLSHSMETRAFSLSAPATAFCTVTIHIKDILFLMSSLIIVGSGFFCLYYQI